MTHTDECKKQQVATERARADYAEQWPQYCKVCSGMGGFGDSFDPSSYGVGLSSGQMSDFISCSACVDKCPRCAQNMKEELCESCGWTGKESLPYPFECICPEREIEDPFIS